MISLTQKEIMQNWKGSLDKPVVSVCCTTYNHEGFIAQAIESFLMQETNFPFEILVRDDCSTDETAKIIEMYAKKYPSIIKPILEKENTFSKGVRPFWSLFKLAKGNYVALCEGDDYWTDPLKLQKQADFLNVNTEYVICHHFVKVVDNNDTLLSEQLDKTPRDYSGDEMITGVAIRTPTVMFRNFLQTYPPIFHRCFNGDTMLWHLLGFLGKSKHLNSIKVSAHRVHHGGVHSSLSILNQLQHSMDTLRLFQKNLGNKAYLSSRIDKNIEEQVAGKLFLALARFDFKLYLGLFKLIIQDKQLRLSSIMLFHAQNSLYRISRYVKNKIYS